MNKSAQLTFQHLVVLCGHQQYERQGRILSAHIRNMSASLMYLYLDQAKYIDNIYIDL